MPCDTAEATRLGVCHQLWTGVLHGRLTTVPFPPPDTHPLAPRPGFSSAHQRHRSWPRPRRQPRSRPLKVLDLGAGPGDWAIAMARQFPAAEIVGVDASAWKLHGGSSDENDDDDDDDGLRGPPGMPDNLQWVIDDIEPEAPVEGHDHGAAATAGAGSLDHPAAPAAPAAADLPPAADGPRQSGRLATTATGTGTSTTTRGRPWAMYGETIDLEPDPLEADVSALLMYQDYGTAFDLVHLRNLKGAFEPGSWPRVFRAVYESLGPGGWIEVIEVNDLGLPEPGAGAIEGDPAAGPFSAREQKFPMLTTLLRCVRQAARLSKRPLSLDHLSVSALEQVGFSRVELTEYTVPSSLYQPHTGRERRGIPASANGSAAPLGSAGAGSAAGSADSLPSQVRRNKGKAPAESVAAAGANFASGSSSSGAAPSAGTINAAAAAEHQTSPRLQKLSLVSLLELLEAASMRLLTRYLGWTVDAVQDQVQLASSEVMLAFYAATRLADSSPRGDRRSSGALAPAAAADVDSLSFWPYDVTLTVLKGCREF